MRCKWSHNHEDIDIYCRTVIDPEIADRDPGCDPFTAETMERSNVKNWDKDHGIYCSHEPYENGNYPLGTVCWHKCLPGYVHEEVGITFTYLS